MSNEILNRADELRAAAAASETRAKFRMKFPTWNMESINHAISVLDLKFSRDSEKPGAPKQAQACPKLGKGAKS